MTLRPPVPTLFPYTTLFRSRAAGPKMQLAPPAVGHGVVDGIAQMDLRKGDALAVRRFVEQPFLNEVAQHGVGDLGGDRKSTRLNSSHVSISYAVFCLKKIKA